MSPLERIHEGYVSGRRARKLSNHLAKLLPQNSQVLDVGCGDGSLARLILKKRPDISIIGIDILIRSQTQIHVSPFDGETFPFENASFDVVMFVDVLHHTDDPMVLLREAVRVSRGLIVIKDHTADGFLASPTLRFMDRVGNARHGVTLPFNYWTRQRWLEAFQAMGLTIIDWESELEIYPWPASVVFGRSLHFATKLDK